MERFGCGSIFEVYVAKKVVVETDMPLEAQLTLYVELTPLNIANNASTAEIILLLQLLSPRNRKAIKHYRQYQRDDDLIDEYDIDILEDLEGREAKIYIVRFVLLEEIADKAVNCLEGGIKDEGEALSEVGAVWIRVVLEEEVHDDAEEVLQDDVGDHRQQQMVLRPPNRQQQGFYIRVNLLNDGTWAKTSSSRMEAKIGL